MNKSYLFAAIAAVVIVGTGIFLLGRDGTDLETSALPINTEATTVEDSLEEPILEEGDASTTPEVFDLPETSEMENDEELEIAEIETDTLIVRYSDSGFTPKRIVVSEGDTVEWINESNRNLWVASNVHPTHNEYPEETDTDCAGSSFDACIGIPSGESWSFTFNEVGEWGYHNHLNVSRTGIVEVK